MKVDDLNETAMLDAVNTFKENCDLDWSAHEFKYDQCGKFRRDDSAALKLRLFRSPRLEEILPKHLNSLKQAATTWKADDAVLATTRLPS